MPGVAGNFGGFGGGDNPELRRALGLPGGGKDTSFSMFGDPASFTSAARTQAGDYDRIMKSYGDLASGFASRPLTAGSISPQSVTPREFSYRQSGDTTGALSNLSELSRTGGYSAGELADIRARDISPIRSIYANAQQNVERQRALSGGYSPNFNAVQQQMARDEANAIADKTTAVNAGIAEMVARGRLSAAPSYASAAGAESARGLEAGRANTEIVNQINQANAERNLRAGEFNASQALEAQRANRQDVLGAVHGQASLYGTTPALTQTFGNQVVQAGQLGLSQQQLDEQRRRDILNAAIGVSGR